MLHLAQLEKQEFSNQLGLRVLARQEAEYVWTVLTEQLFISRIEPVQGHSLHLTLHEGQLVLVELSSVGEIYSLQDATTWVLEIIQIYLSKGITPDFLEQETERAEKWRQTLTLQNQELSRRSLEVEARREQIQALEEKTFKRDKEGDNPES